MNITIPVFLALLLSTSALFAQSNTSPLMMFDETDPIENKQKATQQERARRQEARADDQGEFRQDSSALVARSNHMNISETSNSPVDQQPAVGGGASAASISTPSTSPARFGASIITEATDFQLAGIKAGATSVAHEFDHEDSDSPWRLVESRSSSPVTVNDESIDVSNIREIGGVPHHQAMAFAAAFLEGKEAEQNAVFHEIVGTINQSRRTLPDPTKRLPMSRDQCDMLQRELTDAALEAASAEPPASISISSSTKAVAFSSLKRGENIPAENREEPRFANMRKTIGIPRDQVKAWILAGEEDIRTGSATQAAVFKKIISDTNTHRAELRLPPLSEQRQQLLAAQLGLRAREARGEMISDELFFSTLSRGYRYITSDFSDRDFFRSKPSGSNLLRSKLSGSNFFCSKFSESDFFCNMLYPPVSRNNEEVSSWQIVKHFSSQHYYDADNSLGTGAGYNRVLNANEAKWKIWYLDNLTRPSLFMGSCLWHGNLIQAIDNYRSCLSHVATELNSWRIAALNKSLECLEKRDRIPPSQDVMSERARSHYLEAAVQYQMEELREAIGFAERNFVFYCNRYEGYYNDEGEAWRPAFIAQSMARNTEGVANCELGISSSNNNEQTLLLQEALKHYEDALEYRAELLFEPIFWNQAAERTSSLARLTQRAAETTIQIARAREAGNEAEGNCLTVLLQEDKDAAKVEQAFLEAKLELAPQNADSIFSKLATEEEQKSCQTLQYRDADFFNRQVLLLDHCRNRTIDLFERTSWNRAALDVPLDLLRKSDDQAAQCQEKSARYLKEGIRCLRQAIDAREKGEDATGDLTLSERYIAVANKFFDSAEMFSRDNPVAAVPRRDAWTDADTEQLQINFDEATRNMDDAITNSSEVENEDPQYNQVLLK